MTNRDEADRIVGKFKRISDVMHELELCMAILRFGRGGHATAFMVEQAIEILERHLKEPDEVVDAGMRASVQRLVADLKQVLVDGVHTMRRKAGPGAEILEVEEPLAKARLARGHNIRRQHRCSFGRIDIYDLTADEIIECKASGSSSALADAGAQLSRYRRAFPGSKLTIAVPYLHRDTDWLIDVLRGQGIEIIEMRQE